MATEPLRIRERLAGHHILLTGSTGFLARAFLEKLLRAVDTVAGIHLLVRSRSGGASAEQRVLREVAGSRAFDRLRASLGDRFTRRWEEFVHVVEGDLTKERLGLERDAYAALTRRITLVVNSAATVTFDERIDLAVELNTLGPRRLLAFASDCGNVPFMHVSTCYVCGSRTGTVVEDFSPPDRGRESLPRVAPGGGYDLDALVESMRMEAGQLRHRFGADTDMCRKELIEAGMRRARAFGWNDTYTFTKWLGEQLLARDRGDVPLVIFRPAIIEGSFSEPIPGWIDGLRMADPIIVAYGKGKLCEFPGRDDIPIDLIPVDFVANAMIATLPVGAGWNRDLRVYHCASSDRNPLRLGAVRGLLQEAFLKRPMNDDDGRPVHPKPFRLVPEDVFMRRWQGKRQRVRRWQNFLKALGITGRRFRRAAALARRVDQLIYFAKIYLPYTHLDIRFSDVALREAATRLPPEDRAAFPFDVADIDWHDYVVNRHVPGLRSFVLGTGGEPTAGVLAADREAAGDPAAAGETLRGDNLFDVFRRSAERFGAHPAMQIRRNARWVRYTYEEALHATGAVMQRLVERGLSPGDRLAICGENGPEWGLTYLATMRAGLTAVPLDPQLPPQEAWAAARFAEAKLMCASGKALRDLREAREPGDPPLVAMEEPFIPRPGAARDAAPDPVPVDEAAVASILFTSGTTVSPRAVQLTHRNLIANATALLKVHSVGSADQLLSVLPMYHAFEFTGGFLVPLACGATITYVEQLKRPDIVTAMQATGTTCMLVVPRLLRMFHDSIENTVASSGPATRLLFRCLGALSTLTGHRFGRTLYGRVHRRFGGRLRMFVSGGSRLDPALFTAFTRMGFEVYEGYGLTETAPVLAVNPSGRARAGSVGPPLPGVDIRIHNANLEGIGEVLVRGPSVMVGYLKNPAATDEVLVDRWLHTGDLGRLDGDGYLYLTGRSKDLIVTGAGKNVYPDEVEAYYGDLPFARELCVFGMPSDDGMGDMIHAVVVIDSSTSPELDRSSIEREIRLAVTGISESLPSHQRITTLHFWECDLPKTSTLKAKRSLIRDMVRAEQSAEGLSSPPAATPSGDPARVTGRASGAAREPVAADGAARWSALCAILSRQASRPSDQIRADMHLHLDLGIDSIGKMEILGEVEAVFDKRIDGNDAAGVARVSDLLKLIGPRLPKGKAGRVVRAVTACVPDAAAPAANGAVPAPLLPLRWAFRGGVAALMHSYVRVRACGCENIPSSGAFVLAPNHASHLDSPSVVTAVGGRRRVWIAGAEDYFFSSTWKRIVFGMLLDTIPFDRKADGVLGLRRCAEALARGDGLLLFPEGTRSTTGDLQPFKIGVAVLSLERQVPIIPVYIDSTYRLLAKGARFVRPGRITVTFGRPIPPPPPVDQGDRLQVLRALAQQVERAVSELSGQPAV